MLISLLLGLIMGSVSVIFALQNNFAVTVTFINWELTTSLAVLVILSILVGIMITLLFSLPSVFRSSFAISRLKKENKKIGDELLAMKVAEQERKQGQTEGQDLRSL